jgi:integrase
MKLTQQNVRTLIPGSGGEFEWDPTLPGFGVRVRDGRRTFVVQYRIGGQQRRETLGDVRKVNLADAREIARKRFAQVELGIDPGADKVKARRQSAVTALTLEKVAARHLEAKRDVVRPSTYRASERHFREHWAPLGEHPLAEITRAMVAARLQEIVQDYGRSAGTRARSVLSSLFLWAMQEGLCENNPVIGTRDPLKGIDTSRDRILLDAELKLVWQALGDDEFGKLIKLLTLSGLRRDELGKLKWSEVSGDTITIPASRSKNGKEHSLTLPPMAMEILNSIPRRPGRDYLFGKSGHGFTRWATYMDELRQRLGDIPPFVVHDLRRTFRSGLGRLGIPSHVAELAINHTRKGIEATYDRHRYEPEITAALLRWSSHVAVVIEGRESDNVVPLKKA